MAVTLVTGGSGFIGRYVVERFVAVGDTVVSYNRDYTESASGSVAAVQGELYDIPRLLRTMRDLRVERIVHTAAQSHPEVSIDLPITTFTANVEGTLYLYEAARLAEVPRIVNFSSEAVYGDHPNPLAEDAPRRPTTPYGVTKVTGELMADVYSDLYGLDVVSLRPSEVYGPGNRMPSVINEMLRAGLRGEPLLMARGAEHRFNFVHARDVATAALAAAAANEYGQRVYNVAGDGQHSLAEAARIVHRRFPEANIEIGPGYLEERYRQGHFDISAARHDLGYAPEWNLERGIEDYAEWLGDHPY